MSIEDIPEIQVKSKPFREFDPQSDEMFEGKFIVLQANRVGQDFVPPRYFIYSDNFSSDYLDLSEKFIFLRDSNVYKIYNLDLGRISFEQRGEGTLSIDSENITFSGEYDKEIVLPIAERYIKEKDLNLELILE